MEIVIRRAKENIGPYREYQKKVKWRDTEWLAEMMIRNKLRIKVLLSHSEAANEHTKYDELKLKID